MPLAVRAGNISAQAAFSWGSNIGWLNWRGDVDQGVDVGQFVCAGFAYSANLGWINFGSGRPANGVRYQNNSATDFGVNVDAAGRLRGLAYGANVGWIAFEDLGAPQVDLLIGELSGYAYGANVGWISLTGPFSLQVDNLSPGVDSDGDGIPDAWEILHAGHLTTLSASGDFDGDGQTDLEEYLADTDPLDPDDYLQLLGISLSPDKQHVTVSCNSKPTRGYEIQSRPQWDPYNPWQDVGLGVQLPDGPISSRSVPASPGGEFFRIRAVRPLSD